MKNNLIKKIEACNLLIDGILKLEQAYSGLPDGFSYKYLEKVNHLKVEAAIDLEEYRKTNNI
tara:strand:+ start:656 stop:841 length:186 start_codon:yes stop_codon:yes gene_type:complete